MKHNVSKTRFWLTLALVNVAVMVYPIGLYLQAESSYNQVVATLIMLGVAAVLVITDLVSAIVAYMR